MDEGVGVGGIFPGGDRNHFWGGNQHWCDFILPTRN